MKNIRKFKVVILATVLLVGCSKEIPLRQDVLSEIVPVKIGTMATIGSQIDGVTLSSVRIIAVNTAASDRIDFNRRRTADDDGSLGFIDNGSTTIAGDFIINMHPGTYDFYVIINEESALLTDALDDIVRRSDLAEIKLTSATVSAMTEATVLCVGTAKSVSIREAALGTGQVSLDGGTTWGDKLNMNVERAATKLTVRIRKNTDNPDDMFTVNGATLSNVPDYAYLLSRNYDGQKKEISLPVSSGQFVENQDDDEFTVAIEEYIMPEYIFGNAADATELSLEADYVSDADQATYRVEYAMPLLGESASNRNLLRNKHYIVSITITERGAFEYTPYIEYEVGDWDIVADGGSVNLGGGITTSGRWADGTQYEQGSDDKIVIVRNNGSATFEFSLMQPEGGRWKAYLTNDRDFSLSGDTEGLADEDRKNNIVIRPNGEFESDNITTEFYILINNGVDEAEWDFINDKEVGLDVSGERYVIKYAR